MATTNAYTTVAEVREHLGDSGSKLDVDLLERAITTASRGIDRYCSGGKLDGWRKFWLDADVTTKVFQVDDPGLAWVDDIGSTTGLVVKTDDDGDGVYETTWTQGTDFHLEPLNMDVVASGDTATPWAFWRIAAIGLDVGTSSKRFSRFQHRATLQVTARWGWSSTPAEVNFSAILLAVKLFKRKDSPFGVAGMNEFGAVRIVQQDPDLKALLEPYVKRRERGLVFMPQRNSIFHQRWT